MKRAENKINKPFLRWAGGKQWIVDSLLKLTPTNFNTYYEPFLGGGSLFFALCPEYAVLGDKNRRLIETFKIVRDRPFDVIRSLSKWANEKEVYYKVRSQEYSEEVLQAAQLIYLNKSCWNGLFRVNKNGWFNVPFGDNGREIYNKENIVQASKILKGAKLFCCDFQKLVKDAKSGDFIYFDPPYTVLSIKNGFRRYNEDLFSWEDQVRLAETACELADKGCYVVVTNANYEEIIKLYPRFDYQKIKRQSTLAADPLRRTKTEEALFISA